MKIALIRMPSIIDATASTSPICPPIGLAYLKSILNKFTQDIRVVDSIGNLTKIRQVNAAGQDKYMILGQSAEELAQEVSFDTELILVSIMFSQDWPYARLVLKELRNRCPNAKIILGGEHITAAAEFSMDSSPEIDMCVLGEGELTLEEIVSEYMKVGSLPLNRPGTFVRISDHEIRKNPRRERIPDIDKIPWPDWEGFPLGNYFSEGHSFGVNLGRTMPVLASRGCPFLCKFCSSPVMWNKAWKARSPDDVVAEIKFYIEKYKAENFDFYDLTLIIQKDWILRFSKLLIAGKLNITWQLPSGTRSEAVDREVARLLYRSGCRNLSYAPESGSGEVLRLIKKNIQISRMLDSIKDCVEEGLNIKVNIMCGFPGEKIMNLGETFIFIIKLAWHGVNDMSINQFSPYPGSELFETLIAQKKISLDGFYFRDIASYSSMNNVRSYSEYLTNRDILVFKYAGTAAFYIISFLRYPQRLIKLFRNLIKGAETSRLEKTIYAYLKRRKC